LKPCIRKSNDGKCPYFETCYGVHENNKVITVGKDVYEKLILENNQLKEKLKSMIDLYEKVKCKVCKKLKIERMTYVMCQSCDGLYCVSCLADNFKVSQNEENQNTKEYFCPWCKETVEKGSLIKIDFNQNFKTK